MKNKIDGEILNVPVSWIDVDPEIPNYRGPVRNTTDIQPSIRTLGVQQPLWVREAADTGRYWLIDGQRRLMAARAVDKKYVPVSVKRVDVEGARDLAILANVHEDWPDIVLDGDGKVIGGLCMAVKEKVDRGAKKYEVADLLGIRADVAGAYYCLVNEDRAIQERVASGQLQITVYSLIKKASPLMKEYILRKKGNISAGYVRGVKKEWSRIKKEVLAEWAKVVPLEKDSSSEIPEPVVPQAVIQEVKGHDLIQLKNLIYDIKKENLLPGDIMLLEDIRAAIDLILE